MSADPPTASVQLGAELPDGVRQPYGVFIDGVELAEGVEYEERPGAIALRVAVQPRRESRWRDLVSTVAGIGFYRQGDYVDVAYADAHGRKVVATLPVTRIGQPTHC
jgi:hypothetical protein